MKKPKPTTAAQCLVCAQAIVANGPDDYTDSGLLKFASRLQGMMDRYRTFKRIEEANANATV